MVASYGCGGAKSSWKEGRWEVGWSTPAGKRQLARGGANLTSSAHLIPHEWPSRPSVVREEKVVLLCASRVIAQMPDAQCLMWMCTVNVEGEA